MTTEDYQPRHRRCILPEHHQWVYLTGNYVAWMVFECRSCGQWKLEIP